MTVMDIVERLRALYATHPIIMEAADEIERLKEQVAAAQASSGYEAAIAQLEIERLRELLRGVGANRYWEGRWRDEKAENERLQAKIERLQAALAQHTVGGWSVTAKDFER